MHWICLQTGAEIGLVYVDILAHGDADVMADHKNYLHHQHNHPPPPPPQQQQQQQQIQIQQATRQIPYSHDCTYTVNSVSSDVIVSPRHKGVSVIEEELGITTPLINPLPGQMTNPRESSV